jgi:hypothetical protein
MDPEIDEEKGAHVTRDDAVSSVSIGISAPRNHGGRDRFEQGRNTPVAKEVEDQIGQSATARVLAN